MEDSAMKQSKIHRLVLWIGVSLWSLAGGVPLASCGFIPPPTYSAEAIEAWVVDEDTGQPLEGVIVVAHWALRGGLHPDVIGQLMVMEVVTDANGRFQFPTWGPKLRPVTGYLHVDDPELLFFKSGYEYLSLANHVTEEVNTSSVRRSEWNQQTIKLKKFTGSVEEYAKRLIWFDDQFNFAFKSDTNCEWKQIPRMLVTLEQERKRLKEKGLGGPRSLEYRNKGFNSPQCGSMQELLRSYLP